MYTFRLQPPPGSAPPPRRRATSFRRPISCTNCRHRKTRCDRKQPCACCTRHGDGALCTYGSHARRPQAPDHELVELRERLERLERTVKGQAQLPSPTTSGSAYEPLSPEESADGAEYTHDSSSWAAVLGELGDLKTTLQATYHAASSPAPPQPADPVVAELLSHLPPEHECRALVARYLTYFSSLFHILHEPTLTAQLDVIFAGPAPPLPLLALLFVVLGLSHLTQPSAPSAPSPTQRYNALALRALVSSNFMSAPTLVAVQALLLLIYATNLSSDTTSTAHALLGLATALATALDLHRPPRTHNAVEAEQRRRAWAALRMLDAVAASSFARPALILRGADAVGLPADADDADITPRGVVRVRSSGDARVSQMTYLNLKFRLLSLTARICAASDTRDYTAVTALGEEIQREAETWPAAYRVPDKIHSLILSGQVAQMQLLLHRPWRSAQAESARAVREAAEEALRVYRALAAAGWDGFEWYLKGLASWHVFHAGVVMGVEAMQGRAREGFDEVLKLLGEVEAKGSKVAGKAVEVLRVMRCVFSCLRKTQLLTKGRTQLPPLVRTPSPEVQTQEVGALWDGVAAMGEMEAPELDLGAMDVDASALQEWLEADVNYWLTPGSMSWPDGWGELVEMNEGVC
ncbi:fungal-specific transcription factor domain-containing protein [Geopyxis carbonaria]|nr:fungal-specific transcription factor domain-containing protein [Geopyxis carbonaria]